MVRCKSNIKREIYEARAAQLQNTQSDPSKREHGLRLVEGLINAAPVSITDNLCINCILGPQGRIAATLEGEDIEF